MNKLDFAAINAALDPGALVPQWVPGGQRRGNEWVAANPTRADRTPGSFSINLNTGRWKDFATGDSGKDLVSLYAYLFHDDDQGEAAKDLASSHGIRLDNEARQRAFENVRNIEEAKPRLVLPVPPHASKPKFWHPQYGEPARTWAYRDLDGQVLLYVARYDVEPRKQILPRSWCVHPDGTERWTFKGPTGKDKRPLYGMDRLANLPDADVVLVEGEKAADAGQEIFGEHAAVLTWMGGVETADKVDVRPLAGRRVILWPDFDAQRQPLTKAEAAAGVDPNSKPMLPMHEQPGMRAMMDLCVALKGVASEVVMVGYAIDEDSSGWDLADGLQEGWGLADVMDYMGTHSGDPKYISAGRVTAPPAPAAPPAPPAGNDNFLPLDASVNPFGFPHLSDKGQPMNTVENLEYMLGEYGITARYNETKKSVEVHLPGRSYSIDNRANCSLAELNSICSRNRMPVSMLADYVKLIADRNAYNPVREWITSKPWDGQARLHQLLGTVQTDGDQWLKERLITRWMLSAVASVFMPHGFEGHGCLVFTGAQGLGKTTWFRKLAPADLGVVLMGAILDPSNKDTVTNAVSHWIVELGELDATFRKADIARLKSFIPLAMDKMRRPYDRVESEYMRRTVFCASVNDDRYLVDDTGNRRWWTVPVKSINYQHGIDMQQVWAEVLAMFQAGEQHYLTREEHEALEKLNAEHEAVDPIEEMIRGAFKWDDGPRVQRMTASEVLIAIGFDKPTKANATHASKLLKKITGGDAKKSGSARYFEMPAKAKGRTVAVADDDLKPF